MNALTDVTGFGLLGHLLEMTTGAKLRARLDAGAGAHPRRTCPRSREQGVVPGGTKANLDHVAKRVRFPDGLPEDIQWVLADAQTNGGLLAAVPRDALRRPSERSPGWGSSWLSSES